jgi:hypothetical protein
MPHLIEQFCFLLHKLSWTTIVELFPGACGAMLLALSPDAVPSTRCELRKTRYLSEPFPLAREE